MSCLLRVQLAIIVAFLDPTHKVISLSLLLELEMNCVLEISRELSSLFNEDVFISLSLIILE